MREFRLVFMLLGVLLIGLALAMVIPATVDAAAGNPDWQVFAVTSIVTLFFGAAVALANRCVIAKPSTRQAFLIANLSWLVLALFGSLPFVFCELDLDFTDAFFEAMSGITTTGSTVITGLDTLPPGLLLWRAILQWLGGLGIIVMAISILPGLRIGGMQMFRVEAFETQGKTMPRMAQISGGITLIYIAFTILWAIALWFAGMTSIEAVVHSMTTIATGGYSTSDGSISHFDDPLIEAIITAGMVAGGIPFVLYLGAIDGKFGALFRDSQVHWYLTILLVAMLVVGAWLWIVGDVPPLRALRYASFNVVSIMTGTGYASTDYGQWASFPQAVLFFLTFVGGCAGSTACGIKVFRFQILHAAAVSHIRRLLQPHGVFIPVYNRRAISDELTNSVLTFFFMFGACFVVLSLALSLLDLDLVTAASSVATAMANVGPGLGPIIGPSGTFQSLPDIGKWLLTAGMLIGRLEVLTVMVLLSAAFWRN